MGLWHSQWTLGFRRAAKISYPQHFAPEEKARTSQEAYSFNCVQRSHSNFMEHHTIAVVSLLVAGLRFPVTSAALGGVWSLGRVVYAVGYAHSRIGSGGKGRYKGLFATAAEAVLFILAGVSTYQSIME